MQNQLASIKEPLPANAALTFIADKHGPIVITPLEMKLVSGGSPKTFWSPTAETTFSPKTFW